MSVMKIKDENGNWVPIITIKGEDGKDGKDAVIDSSYNPTSENAQSGKAVAEAVNAHNESTEAHEDIRSKINSTVNDVTDLFSATVNHNNRISALEYSGFLTEESATRYDNLDLAVKGTLNFKPNSLYLCTGNGQNLTLKKWNGTAYEILVKNSPTIICICSSIKTNENGDTKWSALFVYQSTKNYGLVTLPNMVVDVTTISPTYQNTLTLEHTGNGSTTDAYIFYQHTGE